MDRYLPASETEERLVGRATRRKTGSKRSRSLPILARDQPVKCRALHSSAREQTKESQRERLAARLEAGAPHRVRFDSSSLRALNRYTVRLLREIVARSR